MTYYVNTVDSPCGPLLLVVNAESAVVRIEFCNGRSAQRTLDKMEAAGAEIVEDAGRTAEVRRQLAEYFAGERRQFDLKLAPEGTPFERAVWTELAKIPFGETRSYGEIAQVLGRPGSARAVGRANGANPIPIVVPCHRVIGADGSLTGFGGGLEAKSRLLELEGGALPFG
ncbi:MAG TPA: methylated-DNA--[protein]-cysteine S-methyltransferase [Thermoanaerobaculia bacterium]|nr:methylated-DNA--[protein]-cysteine S-methyltransferase [Thermoanaerobaculia bacterium]